VTPTASPIRFGLIGYGAWGRHHAAALNRTPGAVLHAICCRSQETATRARAEFPTTPIFHDYRVLLRDVPLDAVDIVVPTDLHAEIGVAALESGRDVLLEKPMALTLEECDRLLAASAASDRVLSIGHEFRVSTQWRRVKQLIDAGELGDPLYALVSLFRFPYRRGSGDWRWTPARVGSWILEEPVHFFDLVMWYFERWGDPLAVLAVGNSKGRTAGMYDNVSAFVRFPGGRYAVITQTIAGFEHHQVMEVVGTEGSARTWWSGVMDRTREPSFELKVQRRGQERNERVPLEPSGEIFELEEELRQTVAAFRDRRPLYPGAEARKRIAVCLAVERSAREGREIALQL
jgi:myo-inositol 2-dehydrogenase/D-chiro-inositol 1-dehydrogenase